jgi:hypothetical protein
LILFEISEFHNSRNQSKIKTRILLFWFELNSNQTISGRLIQRFTQTIVDKIWIWFLLRRKSIEQNRNENINFDFLIEIFKVFCETILSNIGKMVRTYCKAKNYGTVNFLNSTSSKPASISKSVYANWSLLKNSNFELDIKARNLTYVKTYAKFFNRTISLLDK